MIPNMAIEIDGVEFITTAEAVELAREMGKSYAGSTITAAARRGEKGKTSGIKGVKKYPPGDKSPWLIPKDEFIEWLKIERKPGPKSD